MFGARPPEIPDVLSKRMPGVHLPKLKVSQAVLPSYRYVDLWRAVEAAFPPKAARLEYESFVDLTVLLSPKQNQHDVRPTTTAKRTTWPTAPEKEVSLPTGSFWTYENADDGPAIIRLRYDEYRDKAILEIASNDPAVCDSAKDQILRRSVTDSIYKKRTLRISYEAGKTDEYGDMEKAERLQVLFHAQPPVPAESFIVEDDFKKMLHRNIVDLHDNREILSELGVPIRRGVLMFGPPGTGKTHACRYLCGTMPDTTKIFATGNALAQIAAIFSIARLYAPTVLFLEDADLIFSSRDINHHTGLLAELLDQMDGLRRNDEIGVVITTNSLERIESAIKDRPGRISQCVYLGPPNKALRKRYLLEYLKDYDLSSLDIDAVTEMGDGATQAFLREWVFRAVQIASEKNDTVDASRVLNDAYFDEALDEMRRYAHEFGDRVIGFKPATI